MFDLTTERYTDSVKRLPSAGQQIIGYQESEMIIVYQAYRKSIAEFAVANQRFGGPDFSYNRMSWIKPNFLWMMFRCGWAEKEGQEYVLAIKLRKTFFIEILNECAFSSFNSARYHSRENWQADLALKEVRLQWDPDHDPFGSKLERRAIQLGLKGNMLERFGKTDVISIVDITPFVRKQKEMLDGGHVEKLRIPCETEFIIEDIQLSERLGLNMVNTQK